MVEEKATEPTITITKMTFELIEVLDNEDVDEV